MGLSSIRSGRDITEAQAEHDALETGLALKRAGTVRFIHMSSTLPHLALRDGIPGHTLSGHRCVDARNCLRNHAIIVPHIAGLASR